MAPGSILHHISFSSTCQFLSPFPYFVIFYFPFHKSKIPKILFFRLSISIRSHFANNREGIDNPLSRWVQVGICLCRYSVACALSPTGLIPWFSKLREILTLLSCITLSSSREKPTQDQEVGGRVSSTVVGEIYAKQRHTKYPS